MTPIPEQTRTVSQLTREIKALLEERFSTVAVSGEISNLHRHGSGHVYFTLKDASAQLSAVLFRGNALRQFFSPQDGMEVICVGEISVYEPRGSYQLIVREIIPKGEGALQAAFERLKRKLSDEGLFDPGRKRPLPFLPASAAVVTSPTGAAIRDMISVMRRRLPSLRILLVPVQVQGAGAAEQIADALDLCNAYGEIDVIIVGRGGGSLEDLWAFNEEAVARAIARSAVPVVSAVGHEIDFTISDFAADVRAATPSVAAELVTQDAKQLLEALAKFSYTCSSRSKAKITAVAERLKHLLHRRAFYRSHDLARTAMQRLDDECDALQTAAVRYFARRGEVHQILTRRLVSMDPGRPLSRGYAYVRREGRIVTSIAEVEVGDLLDVSLRDGRVRTRAERKIAHDEEEERTDV